MQKPLLIYLLTALLLAACKGRNEGVTEEKENLQAKAMLQGVWMESLTEDVVFRVKGDTVYYPDEISQPSFFRVVGDTLQLGEQKYTIIRQTDREFTFKNQTGDSIRLLKTVLTDDLQTFDEQQPEAISVSEVVKTDSVVYYDGQRYHWYIAVNPTKKKVTKIAYNAEGVGVENIFFDNIIHVSLFRAQHRLYSKDIHKEMYEANVPKDFLSHAILADIKYSHVSADGFHFHATLCIPNEASCYMVETLVDFDGHVTMKLLE